MNFLLCRRDVWIETARHRADGPMDDTPQLLERHYIEIGPSILAYFRRRTGTASAADDLLQETFLRAWRQRDRLQVAVSPKAYLFGIARHVGLDALRRQHRMEPLDAESLVVDEQDARDDRLALVRSAIAALPEMYREPLRLKLQHELSYVEIAEVLEIPVGTVRSRLHYAVCRLEVAMSSIRDDFR